MRMHRCTRCHTADTEPSLCAREGICGQCWMELHAAANAGAMTREWWSFNEGVCWVSSPITDIWRPAKSAWEPIGPSDALLAEMTSIRDRVCPDASLNVGPALVREVAGHTEIEGDGFSLTDWASIYIALSAPAHPISTLRHELMHAVWGRLDVGETETLERWGDSLRGIACGYPAEWWSRSGEAEAEAYADFYAPTNGRSRRLPEPPPDAVAVFHRIEAGHVGRRQE